jgi:hypothetical protein
MLKLIAFAALFAGFCWFGTTVQLGSRTLFAHLRAIGQTKESQELFDGTAQSAKPFVDNLRRKIAGAALPKDPAPTAQRLARPAEDDRAARAGHADAGAPDEIITPAERRHLRKLLSATERAAAHP